MDVRMPDGTLVKNVPEGTTKAQLQAKLGKRGISKTTGATRELIESAGLGFGDEFAHAAFSMLGQLTKGDDAFETYKKVREAYNKEQSQFREENPALAIGSSVAGGLLTGAPIGAGIAKQAQAAKSILPIVKQGGLLGLITGAGFAPTIQDVPKQAAIGGALGAATPVALQGAMKGIKGLAGAGKSLAGLPGKFFQSADDASRLAGGKQVSKAFQRDAIFLDDAARQARSLGPEAVLADVGGENVRKLAQNVASLPGKSAQIAEQTLQSRMNRSVPRILTALKKSIGTKGTAFKTTKDLLEKRSVEAGPLYQAANPQNVSTEKMTGLILGLDDVVTSSKGTKLGAQLKSVQNSLLKKSGEPKTLVKELHWAKMDIDDRIGTAMRSGNKTLAGQLLEVKRNLLGVLDDVPEYAQARKIFSDDTSVISAIDRGRKVLKEGPEEMVDYISNISKSEVDGYLIGAQEAIADAIKRTPEGGNAARRVASYAVREKLKQAFPSEDALNQFMQALDVEDTFAQLRNVTIRGSQTQPRISSEAVLAGSAITDAAQGRFISVVMGKIAQFMNNYKHIPEPIRDEIGTMLLSDFSKTGKASQKLLTKLAKQQVRKDQIEKLIYSINAEATPGAIVGEQKALQ